MVEEGALREGPHDRGASEPVPRPFLPHQGLGGPSGQCEGLREATGPCMAEGNEVGTPGQPGVRLPGLIPRTQSPRHRPRSEPGESRGYLLREDSPPQGTLTFSGRTRPLRSSRAGGESGGDVGGATGYRGLRLLDGNQSGKEQAHPNPSCPRRLQGSPLPQAESSRQRQRAEPAPVGGGDGSVGPRIPPLRGGPHPVVSELRQLRVLSRNV